MFIQDQIGWAELHDWFTLPDVWKWRPEGVELAPEARHAAAFDLTH